MYRFLHFIILIIILYFKSFWLCFIYLLLVIVFLEALIERLSDCAHKRNYKITNYIFFYITSISIILFYLCYLYFNYKKVNF